MKYRAPTTYQLTDGEREVQREHAADQEYYCEDCLCRHTQPEYGGEEDECWEYYLLLADAEDRAEAYHEERNWT